MPCDAGGSLIDPDLTAALTGLAKFDTILVASDYDGTLAPIVDDPDDALPDNTALVAFERLTRSPQVRGAVLSGRSIEALESFLGDIDDIVLVGNHGSTIADDQADRVESLTRALMAVADDHAGAAVEAKGTGAAFHYRHVKNEVRAADEARIVASEHGAAIIDGKKVVEAVLGSGDKGTALERLRTQTGAAAVLFVGDDVTDEAAFGVLDPPDVSIKVGPGPTQAMFRVPDVPAVAQVYRTLSAALPT